MSSGGRILLIGATGYVGGHLLTATHRASEHPLSQLHVHPLPRR